MMVVECCVYVGQILGANAMEDLEVNLTMTSREM